MSPTPGSALFKLQQTIADLQRQLDERAAERDEVLAREAAVAAERDEALARETATAEVLGVINSSPGDLAPVFDAMLEKALHLCGAAFGILRTYDGTRFHTAATRGVPEIYAEFLRTNPQLAAPGTLGARIAAGEPVVHVLDRKAEAAYQEGEPHRRASVDLGGGRTTVAVPLTKDRRLVGAIEIYRQHVEAFSDKQIALLQNFAAQAVIAIENARLITETREALEQQTATAEVLGVINSSPGDLAPVFKVILEKAHNLCGATIGALESWDGEHIRAVATRGLPASFEALVREGYRPTADDPHWRLLDGDAFVHIPDQAAIEEPTHRKAVELGIRTFLGIALRKDDVLLGRIVAARREVRPFSEQEIALLRNFAVQAVIAMENARLLSETREALEQQTATAEVLGVINSSPGELAPVFDAILAKAHTLCGIAQGSLELYDGERFRAVACRGLTESFAQMLRQGYPAADNPATRALIEGERFTYIPDLAATEYSITRTSAETEAVRTLLCVPLRREGRLLGMIASARREVRPFSEKEIALLENFATQAVIAMENARLLGELHQRNDEIAGWNRQLEDRVATQLGELERVGKLKRFLAPQLAELIVARGDEAVLETHRRDIVVVFCDLREFTAFAETAEPEEVLDLLREYHGALGPIVSASEGTLDHFSGDGIMIFFNDPVPVADASERAVRMAIEMRTAMAGLQQQWRRQGRRIGFGAGIARGYATLGQIGFADRIDYTAIGTVCNLAARLCAEAKDGQILVSQRVAAAVEDAMPLEEIGEVALKGLSQPVAVYSVPLADGQAALRVIEGGAPSG